MIKFFRKIRQQLLSQNRFSKYLLYAIGEIILVVIGILIALSINNWNQSKILKIEELNILNSLNLEFQENLQKFDSMMGNISISKESSLGLVNNYEERSIIELDSMFINSLMTWTYDPSKGIYNAIVNSGKIELISNILLKNRIANYNDLLFDFKEEEDIRRNFINNHLVPYVLNEFSYNPLNTFIKKDSENEPLLKNAFVKSITNETYQGYLSLSLIHIKFSFDEGEILRKELVKIIKLLNLEINKFQS